MRRSSSVRSSRAYAYSRSSGASGGSAPTKTTCFQPVAGGSTVRRYPSSAAKGDDAVSKYVPGVPNGNNITIAELLEMRSGLYNYTAAPEVSASMDHDQTKVWTPAELLAIAFAHKPNFPPGTAFEYCNTNYALLGLIAEKVDGKPLAQAMQKRLFGPLHLQHTELPAPAVNTIPDPYSHGYLYGSSSVALVGEPPYSPEVKAAARAGTLL